MAPSLTATQFDYDYNHNHEQQFDKKHQPTLNVKTVRENGFTTGRELSKEIVQDTLKKRADGINQELCEPGDEDTFFVADVGEVYRQHLRWKLNLGRVKPHYGKKTTYLVSIVADVRSSCQMQPRSGHPSPIGIPRHRLRLCLQGRDRSRAQARRRSLPHHIRTAMQDSLIHSLCCQSRR